MCWLFIHCLVSKYLKKHWQTATSWVRARVLKFEGVAEDFSLRHEVSDERPRHRNRHFSDYFCQFWVSGVLFTDWYPVSAPPTSRRTAVVDWHRNENVPRPTWPQVEGMGERSHNGAILLHADITATRHCEKMEPGFSVFTLRDGLNILCCKVTALDFTECWKMIFFSSSLIFYTLTRLLISI